MRFQVAASLHRFDEIDGFGMLADPPQAFRLPRRMCGTSAAEQETTNDGGICGKAAVA
jgi:hypothetical protein